MHVKLGTWLLCAALAACGGDTEADATPCNPLANGIEFTPMYSAFGGSHSYSVMPFLPSADPNSKDADPILVSTIHWEVDEKFVSKEAFPDIPGAIKLTTRAAGIAKLHVTAKSASGAQVVCQSDSLNISRASDEDWDKGDARYNSGPQPHIADVSINPEVADSDAGAHSCGLANDPQPDLPKNAACTGCHDGPDSVPHSPLQTAGYSDEQLIAIFTQAQKPAGYTYNSALLKKLPEPDCIYARFHTWSVDQDTQRGLVLKLRSLSPRR